MRRVLCLLAIFAAVAMPGAAQNTDIESLSGLQFNFGNPGARSLGMGGAFLGRADDASAAEANPAGLTILREPEISIEARNYLEQQVLTTSGTFPEVTRTPFTHYSNRVEVTFGSFVYPVKNFTFGGYYHNPLKNVGSGQVVPQRNEFTGAVERDVPNFFLPRGADAPVSKAECEAIRNRTNDFFSCLEYTLNPFLTAVDVQLRTWGAAAAYKIGNFSIGGTVRYQLFREAAFTFRVTPTFQFDSISVQGTAKPKRDDLEVADEKDVTFAGGFMWKTANEKFSIGGVYKQGPEYVSPTFIANTQTKFEFVKLADTKFHIPDVAGIGISVRPIPVLTINVDAVHVTYSNLVDDFVSTVADVRDLENPYQADDVTEIHVGGEYFFPTKFPVAIRAGYWRDPAHSIEWRGPLNRPDAVAAAMLYPKGEAQNHYAIGAGVAWRKFQLDAAYDTSDHYKVGSISFIARF